MIVVCKSMYIFIIIPSCELWNLKHSVEGRWLCEGASWTIDELLLLKQIYEIEYSYIYIYTINPYFSDILHRSSNTSCIYFSGKPHSLARHSRNQRALWPHQPDASHDGFLRGRHNRVSPWLPACHMFTEMRRTGMTNRHLDDSFHVSI